jgi:hypothetical protein
MSRRGQIIRRVGQEHRQELVKLIKQAAYTTSTWRIWDDLMFMGAATIAQTFEWSQGREDEYLRRINQYDKKAQALFPQMFAEIVLALQQEGCADVLGDMYMELELSNHWKGQYFTPDCVCRMMSKITCGDTAELIETQGVISVHDPCCGSGVMLIAFANECLEQGINYQRKVLFVGQDIDPVVARMCYIQMSLLSMPGYVIIGNSLLYPPLVNHRHPECEYLFTPMYYVGGFRWKEGRGIVGDDPSSKNGRFSEEADEEEIPLEIGAF